ncbi:unnamed protein product, partial [Enterobius vermicularis]|uniref:Dihydrolipoamide acetyltransferase component of pyruvate dehydrogenase complex n=1 Tax=Enterobius vermicularis TaxID=51028 RepID=A0A0N4VA80_ENTVE
FVFYQLLESNFLACNFIFIVISVRFFPLVQFKLADIGEGIAEVQIKEWHVKVGDTVSQFDNICEVQSDKASVTITSRYDGVIKKLYYNVDDIAKVGSTLFDIETEGSAEETEKAKKDSAESSSGTETRSKPAGSSGEPISVGKVLATPAVRRIAAEHKVNLNTVKGTGKDGRVLKEDLLRHIGQLPGTSFFSNHLNYEPLTEDKVVPIRGYTRAMIKSMSEALRIPHFGFHDEFYVDRLVEMRKELKELGKERGVRMTYMPIFIKVASMALSEYPMLNSVLDERGENLIYKASHNIGIAMDTPHGLVVPNIKNCEQRNLWEIAEELQRLGEAAKHEQLSQQEISGGTFTLSSVGMLGGMYANPVILPPQVAIGALTKIQKEPKIDKDGEIFAPHVLRVSWSADHRVIDGATVVRFSNLVKQYLENPTIMAAQLK